MDFIAVIVTGNIGLLLHSGIRTRVNLIGLSKVGPLDNFFRAPPIRYVCWLHAYMGEFTLVIKCFTSPTSYPRLCWTKPLAIDPDV